MRTNRISLPLAQVRALEAIYAELPRIECQQRCQECCGPILMSRLEWQRILLRTGEPRPSDDSLTCPSLDRRRGTCQVYSVRPLVCRLWGVVEAMRCPWGCVPERWLSDEEAHRFVDRVMALEGIAR